MNFKSIVSIFLLVLISFPGYAQETFTRQQAQMRVYESSNQLCTEAINQIGNEPQPSEILSAMTKVSMHCACIPKTATTQIASHTDPLSSDQLGAILASAVVHCGAETVRSMFARRCPTMRGANLATCECANKAIAAMPDIRIVDNTSSLENPVITAAKACGIEP